MAYYSDRKANDPRFPGVATDGSLPPSPSPENPGSVFPSSSDPEASQGPGTGKNSEVKKPAEDLIGNPFLMHAALDRVDKALSDVTAILEEEGYRAQPSDGRAPSPSTQGRIILQKFKAWRGELHAMREGGHGDGTTGRGLPNTVPQSKSTLPEQPETLNATSGFGTGSGSGVVTQEGPMFTD